MDAKHNPTIALAGSAVAVSDTSSQLAATIARRLAVNAGRLFLASAQRSDQSLALAEVERVRLLSGQYEPVVYLQTDTLSDAGAEAFVLDMSQAGGVDAVVHVAAPANGTPPEALQPVVAMMHHASRALIRRGGGRLLIVLDLSCSAAVRFSSGALARLEQAFEEKIRIEAARHFPQALYVNGLVVRPSQGEMEWALSWGAGSQAAGEGHSSPETYSAAAGVAELLTAGSATGITGQVFRVGGAPPMPAARTAGVRQALRSV